MNYLDKLKHLDEGPATDPIIQAEPQPTDWLSKWYDLAQVTSGLESDDPRLTPTLSCLAQCQHCHEAGDVDGFTKAAARVRRLMQFVPGATVIWEGHSEHRLTILGPSKIEHVHSADGRLWVWVDWDGTGRWVSETIVQRIESR